MNEQEFREKFGPSRLCVDCKILRKVGRKTRCSWCQLKKDGTDAEVQAAYDRQSAERMPFENQISVAGLDPDTFIVCSDCRHLVPDFYLDTKKRCRGCGLIRSRDRRDAKQYGVGAGTRSAWLGAQNGCWGCQKSQRFTGMAMHHDHQTGKPYYMACKRCNQGMGEMNDSPEIMLRLALGMIYPPHEPGNAEIISAYLSELLGSSEEA